MLSGSGKVNPKLGFDSRRISSLVKIIQEQYGLSLAEMGMDEFKSILEQRIQELKLNTFLEYLSLIYQSQEELDELVSRLTIGESSFFRTPAQIWTFRDHILPEIIKRKQAQGRNQIRILSAGSAGGEEPYSIAMIVRGKVPPELAMDIKIVACDVNKKFLKRAGEGIYPPRSLRNMDRDLIEKYFEKKGKNFKVKSELKKFVQFLHFNLISSKYELLTREGYFDVIFCRNVLIYFNPRSFNKIIDNFYQIIEPYGYLILGYSESLYGLDSKFKKIYLSETFLYQKIPASEKKKADSQKQRKTVARDFESFSEITAPQIKPVKSTDISISTKKPRPEVVSDKQVWKEAWQLLEKEEYEKARRYFEALIESTFSPQGYLGMAFVFAHQGEDELSEKYLKIALEKDELIPEAYYLSGLLAERREEWEKAIQNYQRAIFLKSDFIMAHFNLANLYLKLSEFINAKKEFKIVVKLLQSAPEKTPLSGGWNKSILMDWANFYLGKLNSQRNER